MSAAIGANGSRQSDSTDVVIVGGGVAGSALAIVLCRQKYSVVLLEKTLVHTDRVRGEVIVPWGVGELRKLGLLDVLVAAGGHFTTRAMPYGQGVDPADAQSRSLDLGSLIPDVAGSLNLGHPKICNALNDVAGRAGAVFLRGVERVEVTSGERPNISFNHDGQRRTISPALIVGADGRGSAVARQIGAKANADPTHHFLTGLLLDGFDAWPAGEQASGNDRDIGFYVFPQGNGRARLYAAHAIDQNSRFAGRDGAQKFIEAFDLPALPHRQSLLSAKVAGPCHGYANHDIWLDRIVAPGVVLVGDAAGHNDPSIAQGLSLSLRDVRLVGEALANGIATSADGLVAYQNERRHRMGRLRVLARLLGKLRWEFTDAARERRLRVAGRMKAEPELGLPMLAVLKGHDAVPDSVYGDAFGERLLE